MPSLVLQTPPVKPVSLIELPKQWSAGGHTIQPTIDSTALQLLRSQINEQDSSDNLYDAGVLLSDRWYALGAALLEGGGADHPSYALGRCGFQDSGGVFERRTSVHPEGALPAQEIPEVS